MDECRIISNTWLLFDGQTLYPLMANLRHPACSMVLVADTKRTQSTQGRLVSQDSHPKVSTMETKRPTVPTARRPNPH